MNIGVVFGSRSVEHDVSITSAYGVMMGLKKHTKHTIFPIYITREGKWIYDPAFMDIQTFTHFEDAKYKDTCFEIDFSKSQKLHFTQKNSKSLFGKSISGILDFVFPILHGMNGEDGAIQGIFDMLQVPYMGPSILGSSLGMNKIVMKDVFQSLGLPITKYVVFSKQDYNKNIILSHLGFPLIVKPANLGSSIGISKVNSEQDLQDAVDVAFHYDTHIIIERCVQNLKELNCSVGEVRGEVVTTHVEQPVSNETFLSFEAKYVSDDGGTMQGLKNKVKIPADISADLSAQIQEYSKIIYKSFFCKGGAPRIDYLYDSVEKKLYVNEINTIPGALQMHLWEKSGYPVGIFLQNLIDTGIEKSLERKLNIDFQSNIIGHTIRFQK